MSDRTRPIENDSIGQSSKAISETAHQLNRVRPSYQHGVGDPVGFCKFLDFSRLIDADTDNFRTFRGKDLPDGNQHRDLFAARSTPGCPEVAHYDAAPPLLQGVLGAGKVSKRGRQQIRRPTLRLQRERADQPPGDSGPGTNRAEDQDFTSG